MAAYSSLVGLAWAHEADFFAMTFAAAAIAVAEAVRRSLWNIKVGAQHVENAYSIDLCNKIDTSEICGDDA
jgi:hypothetical protein